MTDDAFGPPVGQPAGDEIHTDRHIAIGEPYATTDSTAVLRIGLVRYDLNAPRPASAAILQVCCMCGAAFPIQPISGVAADEAYTFVGNICPDCLKLSIPQLRQRLQRTAAELRTHAASASADPDEVWIVDHLLAEATERDRWANGELLHPGARVLVKAQKGDVHWQPYPLIRSSTAIQYRAWFG